MVASLTNSLGASRDEIVQQLRARGRVSADELAATLGVSKQCVRKHLDVLERDGYVEHAPERGERGRPAHVFRLTAKAEELILFLASERAAWITGATYSIDGGRAQTCAR